MSSPWVLGARLRTLPAAVVPVLVGTAVAVHEPASRGWYGYAPSTGDGGLGGDVIWWRALAAMVVALAIQVGTNFANDYSDGIRGTDDVRVGPVRLVASGLKPAAQVKAAALIAFAVAAAAGLALAAATTWWLLAVGAVSIAAGWLYTGGPRPYGYLGLGEVFVFVFFGVVATVGSTFVQTEDIRLTSLAASVSVGALATALLVVNNLRDIPTDGPAGKRTLAVRLGDARTRHLYTALVAGALVLAAAVAPSGLAAAAALLVAPLAWAPVKAVWSGATGPALIPVLVATGRLQLAFGLAYSLALWLS